MFDHKDVTHHSTSFKSSEEKIYILVPFEKLLREGKDIHSTYNKYYQIVHLFENPKSSSFIFTCEIKMSNFHFNVWSSTF